MTVTCDSDVLRLRPSDWPPAPTRLGRVVDVLRLAELAMAFSVGPRPSAFGPHIDRLHACNRLGARLSAD